MFAFSLSSSEGSQSRVPSAASVILTPFGSVGSWSVLVSDGRRTAVYAQGGAVDERRLGGTEKDGQLGDLLWFDEAFDRGFIKHDLLDHLVLRDSTRTGLIGDLPLDERRPHVSRTDAIGRYAFGSSL